MDLVFSKTFVKAYKKIDTKIQLAFGKKLEIFKQDEFDVRLRNHSLQGKYKEVRSTTITGDFRAHYKTLDGNIKYFVAIGTHSELYEG